MTVTTEQIRDLCIQHDTVHRDDQAYMKAHDALVTERDEAQAEVESLTQILHASEPVALRYFVHSPDEGFEFFATDAERRKEHDARIKRCKEEAYIGDGWPAETEDIVSGTVTHVTEATNVENRPAPCSEHPDEDPSLLSDCEACQAAAEWMHDGDTKCDYEQTAAPPASAAPALTEAVRPTDDALWDQTLDERDSYHLWADKLADAIALHLGIDIGEHSSSNIPWFNALEALAAHPLPTAARDVESAHPSLWEAFEMGFSFRGALLGHVNDGRDVGRLTICEFWHPSLEGMHVGTDLHVGLTVSEAVVRLKQEIRRRLDSIDRAARDVISRKTFNRTVRSAFKAYREANPDRYLNEDQIDALDAKLVSDLSDMHEKSLTKNDRTARDVEDAS